MATVKSNKTEQELRDYYEHELGLTPGNARMMARLYLGKGQGDIVAGNSPLARARAAEWDKQKAQPQLEEDSTSRS